MKNKKDQENPKPILDSLNCDGSYGWKTKKIGWKVNDTLTGEVLLENNLMGGTSNVAEFMAIVDAMRFQVQEGVNIPIYSDSLVAIRWVRDKKCRSFMDREDPFEAEISKLVEDAEQFLQENEIDFEILKWKTFLWGNVPSDGGNKFISKEDKEKTRIALEVK
jgi:ribonuclease HI